MPLNKFKFSYGEKRDILQCPHRYEILVVKKLPQYVDLRRLLVADVVDQALTTWINNKFAGVFKDLVVAEFKSFCAANRIKLKWKNVTDQRDCELKAIEAAEILETAMREHELIRKDAEAQGVVKHNIVLDNGDIIKLTGRLDVLYRDGPWIFDLKTTADSKWLDWNQLIFYDFVVSSLLKKKVSLCGFLAPFINPPVQSRTFGREEWQQLFDDLNKAIELVVSGEYPDWAAENECYTCFAKTHCRRFRSNHSKALLAG